MSSTDKLTQIDCDWFECVFCGDPVHPGAEASHNDPDQPICEHCFHSTETKELDKTNDYFIYHNSRSEGKNQDSPPMADIEFSW